MPLCASGEMSLGGSTIGRSVNCELGRSGTATICMNETAVRSLAGKASGAISISNFYGKSGPPAGLGCFYQGGYYTGAVSSPANYYLVVAPNASGCACCSWKTTLTNTASSASLTDGFLNTYTALSNATHPAGNFTATRSLSGFSDWYLPATCELALLNNNCSSMPAGQAYGLGGVGGTAAPQYWSSTQSAATSGCVRRFNNGAQLQVSKILTQQVRAVRRISF